MNINDLYIYAKVYELKSINKASKELEYAQSNITQRIQLLEEQFNQNFFVRSYTGIKPTKEGRIFYEYSKSVITNTENLKITFSENKKQILCSELLFNVLYKKQGIYEIAKYTFKLVTSSEMFIEPYNHYYDKVLTFNKLDLNNYTLVKTSSLKVGLYINKEYIENYDNLPLLINSDKKCPLRRLSLDILPDKNFIELDSLEAIINIVQNGEGIAILPPDLTSNSSTNNIKVDYKSIPYYEYAFNKRT